ARSSRSSCAAAATMRSLSISRISVPRTSSFSSTSTSPSSSTSTRFQTTSRCGSGSDSSRSAISAGLSACSMPRTLRSPPVSSASRSASSAVGCVSSLTAVWSCTPSVPLWVPRSSRQRGGSGELVMPRLDRGVRGLEELGNGLGDVHGPVLSARAADRDRQVGALEILIARNPVLEEAGDVAHHLLHERLRVEERDDLRVLAVERSKLRFPVRVRQAAYVEHEIRVRRQSVLVAERLDQDRQRARQLLPDAVPDPFAKRVRGGAGRVDDEVCGVDDRAEQDALLRNRLAQADVLVR